MSVLTPFSEKIGEYDITQEPHIRYFEDDMIVLSCGNFDDYHLHYMMVYKRSTDQLCRLNMLKPEYINYPDTTLILNREEIDKLIDILNYKGTHRNGCVNGMNIWNSIIYHTNIVYSMANLKDFYYVPMPFDMPIPDYTKLL